MYTYTPGLGEVLPSIAVTGPNATGMAQYDALASGATQGGNFQHFKDGAEQGFFTNDAAGYGQYLAYNSLGTTSPGFKDLPIEYQAWRVATVFAYAVVAKMHVGNNLSPIYDVATGNRMGQQSILGMATNFGWDSAQRQKALDLFASNYTRLLEKWGYKTPTGGPVTIAPAPVMIENPYFKSLGKIVYVDKATVTYDGPDPDPNVIGGKMFTAGGVTWKWGGTRKVVPPTRYLDIIVDGFDVKYDARGLTMFGTRAWFVLSRGGSDETGKAYPETRTPLTKWTGEYLNYSDTGPKGSLLFLRDLSPAEQAAVAALQGPSTEPSKAEWGWGINTNVSTAPPQNAPIPITDPRNPNYKPPAVTPPASSNPVGTVNPWSDLTAPAPSGPNPFPVGPSGNLVPTTSQPPIQIGPSSGGSSSGGGSSPGPAAALPAITTGAKVALVVAGLFGLAAVAKRSRRRR